MREKPYVVASRAVAATCGPYVTALRPRLDRDIDTAGIHKMHAHLESWWEANSPGIITAVVVETGLDYELATHVVLAAMNAHPIVGAPVTTPTVLDGAILAAQHIIEKETNQ